jgi:5-methyltetrahydropteroyltriglutamate--homocysteine methyltransferase
VPHNIDRVLTTHVGSLIRPAKLIEFWRLIEDGEPYNEAAFEACLAESVTEVVRQQADVGIDIVSDGEFSKGLNWAFYIFKRLRGIAVRPVTPEELRDPMASMSGGQDRRAFPEFYAEYDIATGLGKRLGYRVVVKEPISYSGHGQVGRDIKNITVGLTMVKRQYPTLAGFLPVVAPASALPGAKIEHYKDEEAYLFALAEALHQEYRAIVDAGLYVQIDDAFLPYMHERMVPPMSNSQYLHWAQMRVDALNHALRDIPEDRSRYHICWGSWNGPHVFDVPLKDIVGLLLQVRTGHYSFEAANPRHAHEWRVWETVKLPPGKILIPGVISHATNVVEHPELVAERIVRLAKVVGRESVMGGTDCGFAQSPFARRVHPTIMWAKLKSLVEGARVATRVLWGKQAAA